MTPGLRCPGDCDGCTCHLGNSAPCMHCVEHYVDADYCPVHGSPEQEWPCPVALESDPPEVETCPHFEDEMERRIADMAAGNFWRIERFEDGYTMREFKNHEPTGKVTTRPRRRDIPDDGAS